VNAPSGDIVEQVQATLDSGNTYGARELVETHLADLDPTADTGGWASALQAIARLAKEWGDEVLARAAHRAGEDPADASVLYDVGHRLIDKDVLGMAIPILERAVSLGPTPKALAELVAAFELQGRYADAVSAIAAGGLADGDPLISYLLAFNSAMVGDLAPARDRLGDLKAQGDEPFVTMASTLAAMLARADDLGKDPAHGDLPVWHFVWTGGVLLAPSMRTGAQTWSDLRGALSTIQAALDRLGVSVQRILTPPERASQALGAALGRLAGLAVETWRGEEGAGLLVVHNVTGLDPVLAQALRARPAGQVLYTHIADANREQCAAGDLTGMYGLSVTPPWLGGIDDDGEYIDPIPDGPDELATRILEAEPPAGDDPDRDQFLAEVAQTAFAGAVAQAGTRSRQWVLPPDYRTA
jgi:hypothetical protein